jgi:outer membrane protein assembly factor BamE (lipoprotein component of BamABCDE complex)
VLVLAACVSVSSGKMLDSSMIASVKAGETTEKDLVKMFGEPTTRGMTTEGARTAGWIYTKSKMKNPVKVDLQQQIFVVTLDANGVVSKVESMDTVKR